MSKPISKFARYNKENILQNLLQGEDHAKVLDKNSDPNFSSCINKHLLNARGELMELQAHDKQNREKWRKFRKAVESLRDANVGGELSQEQLVDYIREIRGQFEKEVSGHDVEKCKSCGPIHELVSSSDSNSDSNPFPKLINKGSHSNNIGGKMRVENMIHYTAGAFGAKGIEQLSEYVDKQVGNVAGMPAGRLMNLGLGLGLPLTCLFTDIFKGYEDAVSVAGLVLLANESVEFFKEQFGGAAAPKVAAPAPKPKPKAKPKPSPVEKAEEAEEVIIA